MKKISLLLFLLLTALPVSFAQTTPAPAKTETGNDATVASPRRGHARFYELHSSFLKRTKEGPVGLLFIGDSITEGWRKAPEVWKRYYEQYQPANFGISGDRTQYLLWRLKDGELDTITPRVVVVMIGTNNLRHNTVADIVTGNARIVEYIRTKLPQTKVLLLAVFPRGPSKDKSGEITNDGVARSQMIDEVNEGLAKLDDGVRVRFLNINSVFLDASGKIPTDIMPDQTHPSAAAYELWAKAMHPLLQEMWNSP